LFVFYKFYRISGAFLFIRRRIASNFQKIFFEGMKKYPKQFGGPERDSKILSTDQDFFSVNI
jgi:hypothetical protein